MWMTAPSRLIIKLQKEILFLSTAVPGPTEGSYMATELRFGMQPEFSQKMIEWAIRF